jgi:hypothetical protein
MSNERVFRAQLATRPRSFFAVTRSILNQITRFLTCWNPLFALYRTGIDADASSYLDCLVAGTY